MQLVATALYQINSRWTGWLGAAVALATLASAYFTIREKYKAHTDAREAKRNAEVVRIVITSGDLEEAVVDMILTNDRVRAHLRDSAHSVIVDELFDSETMLFVRAEIDSLKAGVERLNSVFISAAARRIASGNGTTPVSPANSEAPVITADPKLTIKK